MTKPALSPSHGRPLPDFLKQGDKTLGLPRPTPLNRMRAMMGMPEPELKVPEFVRKKPTA